MCIKFNQSHHGAVMTSQQTGFNSTLSHCGTGGAPVAQCMMS